MKIDPNLLIDQKWVGTFFPPGKEELAFGGELSYSPTDGVRLQFAIPLERGFSESCPFLHGSVNGGMPCTLVGDFSPENSGYSMHNGYSYWTSTGRSFKYILFGAHCDEGTTFDSFQFDISGSQEFFGTASSKRLTPYKKGAIFGAEIDAGVVNVHHTGTFDFVPSDLRSILHDASQDALDELQSAYEQVKAHHPDFHPFLKKSLDYSFELKLEEETGVIPAYQQCAKISDLFSLLFFCPAKLSQFHAIGRDEDRRPYYLPVFPSTISEKDTIERSLAERDHHNLPLNVSDVDLAVLVSNWVREGDRFSTIVSMLQSQGSVISSYSVLSSIVLSATQLEDMAYQAGEKNDKFGYGIKAFASNKLANHLAAVLRCVVSDLGNQVAGLRNEIAHVGRPKKILNSLTNRQRYQVCRALEAIVVGYALEKIGVTSASREKYQDSLIVTR